MRSARHRVSAETFEFGNDDTGRRVMQTMIDAAQRGVEVRFCYDALGSDDVDNGMIQQMEAAGVKTIVFKPLSIKRKVWPWARRNHRKSLVVDGHLGIVGGMNLAARYDAKERGGAGWRDTSVLLEGPGLVHLEKSFRHIWCKNGGDHFAIEGTSDHGAKSPFRFMHNFLRKDRAEIHRTYIERIRQAKERIRIMNAYFIPDRRLRRALRHAARRGVKVQVITAGSTDIRLARLACRSYYPLHLKAGIEVFEWDERVLHAKTAVIDGDWATIGSSNLDYLSSFRNLEVNAEIEDPDLIQQLDAQFDKDIARSKPITRESWKERPWTQRAFDFVFRTLVRGY